MDKEFLKEVAGEAGCTPETAAAIDRMTLARELWDGLPAADAVKFFAAIHKRCEAACAAVYPAKEGEGKLTILLLDEKGGTL